MIRLFLKRIWRRFKYCSAWNEPWNWEFESCDRCGHCFRLLWRATDEAWLNVCKKEGGCLCVTCFVEIAKRKGIIIKDKDIERLELFNPNEPF